MKSRIDTCRYLRTSKKSNFMIPKSKKNLHQTEYHLNKMKQSKHFEELEINFCAFVMSARTVTFVLQKEFTNHLEFGERFRNWYGVKDKVLPGTKMDLMSKDSLCKYFKNIRNNVEKEGINNLKAISSTIRSYSTEEDKTNYPDGFSGIIMGSKGIYYIVYKGTKKEDLLPAINSGWVTTEVILNNPPNLHLNKQINDNSMFNLCELYYNFLINLVEEWNEIMITTQSRSTI